MPLIAILAAMAKDYEYRPKYMDIRVKPPGEDIEREKAKIRMCDHPDCNKPGEFPGAQEKWERQVLVLQSACARIQ